MRNLYLFFLTVFCSFGTTAQVIDFPDATFKSKLLEYPTTIDLNEDGEIDVSEALLVTELSFSFANFNNITGIREFENLEILNFGSYTTITEPIDLSGMAHLKSLRFTKCNFHTLNLEGLTALENLSVGYAGAVNFLNFEDTVNLRTVYFYNTNFTQIDLSHAQDLRSFSAQHTELETIVLDGLVNLETFRCEHPGNLTYLNLADLVNLRQFELEGSNLTQLNFEHNLLLEEIKCSENQLNSIDVSLLTALRKLSCNANQLGAIYLGNNPNLEWLSCGENQLSSLDLSQVHRLNFVDVSFNLFTALDFSSLTECENYGNGPEYYINDNPNLTWVNLKNGHRDFIWANANLNCPNLTYLCLDEEDFVDQQEILENNQIDTIEINTYCSFVPGGDYNTITGKLTLDFDNNGCDLGDIALANCKLELSGNTQNETTTDAQGGYSFFTKNGNYTLTPKLENPYFTVSPADVVINFENSNNPLNTQNFCVVPNGIHKDLEIMMLPLKAAQPGTDAHYKLVYKNKGNQTLSGNISLNYQEDRLHFVVANPAINQQISNELVWNFSQLKPFETRSIDLILNLNSSLETPAVVSGDVLRFNLSIPVEDDETASDNQFTLAQTVADTALPNDKSCLQGDEISTELIGDYVHYLIRFQNTGETMAKNVVVKDLVNLAEFDVASLQVIAASNSLLTKISGPQVEFIFQDINLSSVTENEPTSSGFVAFKIKTKDNLVIGDTIENQASVYFDYNFPVETNTATSTISELLSNTTFENNRVSLAPNPTEDWINIVSKDNMTSVELFDLQGRILEKVLTNTASLRLDLSNRNSGIYFLKIKTSNGFRVEKIIKQ